MTDADLLAEAAAARALDVTTGDARFAHRLHFDWCLRRLDRSPEIIDLSTPALLKAAPNTVATLNRALDLGIRAYVD